MSSINDPASIASTHSTTGSAATLQSAIQSGGTSSDGDARAEEEAVQYERFALGRAVQAAAAYLLSAIIHMLVMIWLAVSMMGVLDNSNELVMTATIDGEEAVEIAEPMAEVEFDQEQLEETEALDADMEIAGIADLGEMVASAQSSDDGDILSGDQGEMAEIAAMFGQDEGRGLSELGDGQGGATFFGVKAGGNKFVFVVDGSKSMNGGKWDACKKELVTAVMRLKSHQRFYVILFAKNSYPMFDAKNPEPFCVPPTQSNIYRLQHWLEAFELELGTKPLESIKTAVEMLPDAIYFLTDGEFNDPTEDYLAESNRIKEDFTEKMVPKVAVHTIGFFSQNGKELLSRISGKNNGTYRFVPKPPPPPKKKPRGKGKKK